MQENSMYFMMFNSKIFRNTQGYLEKALKSYGLHPGAIPYLFALEQVEGISQMKLSQEVGNDKAMSARTLGKLIESGFVYKVADERDSRAYRLYLTEEARTVIPAIHREIGSLISTITEDLTEKETAVMMKALHKIYLRTLRFKD